MLEKSNILFWNCNLFLSIILNTPLGSNAAFWVKYDIRIVRQEETARLESPAEIPTVVTKPIGIVIAAEDMHFYLAIPHPSRIDQPVTRDKHDRFPNKSIKFG